MVKKVLISSIACIALNAQTVNLGDIEVDGVSSSFTNISNEEIKSADLAEALSKNSADINMIRRSGIANDIVLRGQKKDNINVTIDDAKVCGACPNRMDPPTSHIVTNNVENVKVIEGPYDVENFGTLSGIVKVTTLAPQEGVHGEANINVGSFGYKKFSANVSGGNDKIKILVGASKETSDQYEDGDGNTLSKQLDNSIANGVGLASSAYASAYKDMDAYEKITYYTKLYLNIANNQQLKLSYMANRSEDVLYASTPMDAESDDSDILNLSYKLDLDNQYIKNLIVDAYTSKVDHPMSTKYRQSAVLMGKYRTNHMKSKIKGIKVKSDIKLDKDLLTVGLDTSKRNWDGRYYDTNTTTSLVTELTKSLPDVDTTNHAMFVEYNKDINNINLAMGARYDKSKVKANATTTANTENDYNALSFNILATLKGQNEMKYFAGFGKASRVPDAKELYWGTGAMADLDQTTNYQVDLGLSQNKDNMGYKAKVFYSKLDNYIYFNSTKYINLDAHIYGASANGYYDLNNNLSLNGTISYLVGQKDEAIAGQDDKDLADIPPLKITLGMDYKISAHTLSANIVMADKWKNYDEDNGEQELSGYSVVNTKYNYKFNKNINLTVGVDNIFDKTYAVSNTYKDLTLINGGGDVMLLNEPGRYMYTNLQYKF